MHGRCVMQINADETGQMKVIDTSNQSWPVAHTDLKYSDDKGQG